jgi:hypothetical protein
MLNCRDLTKLVSESFDRRLTLGERMNLWMHITMCGTCRRFRRLQQHIQAAVRLGAKRTDEQTDDPVVRLPEQSRRRMQQVVLSEVQGNDTSGSDPAGR